MMTVWSNRAGGVVAKACTCGSARYFCGREIVVELRWHVIVRGVSAKTAGREALHCFAARQQRAWTDRCRACSRFVMRGLQTTAGIRSSAAPCVAIGKPGYGVCSAAARH